MAKRRAAATSKKMKASSDEEKREEGRNIGGPSESQEEIKQEPKKAGGRRHVKASSDAETREEGSTIGGPSESQEETKQEPKRAGGKRRQVKASSDAEKREEGSTIGGPSESQEEIKKEPKRAGAKRRRVNAPNPKIEYFSEKRNMEDLWQAAFPVGTEWDNMDKLGEISWCFSNLESACDEGGELHGKTVYMFGSTEAQMLNVNGIEKVVLIPIVVAVDSPIPPSDKIGVKSVQREKEDVISMKSMKMEWIPYIPLEDRLRQVDKLKTQIFTMACTQRRAALKHLRIERVKQYDYCLPYLQSLKADEDEDDTVVNIMFPLEPPIVCDFDWEMDEIEEFIDNLIKEEILPEDKKDEFKEYVKQQVRERRKAQRQAKEARKKAIDDMDPKTREAMENMKFYKFYPVQTPDTPDISHVKVLRESTFPEIAISTMNSTATLKSPIKG